MIISEKEALKIRRVLQEMYELGEDEEPAVDLDYFIERWREVALAVRDGYLLGLDTYRNDVDVRDVLSMIMDAVAPETAEKIACEIEASDALFLESTVEARKPIGWGTDRKWYLRIPKILSGEAESLRWYL